MPSAAVVDRIDQTPRVQTVDDLLVLWQHPSTREIVPIGRFSRDADGFSFYYTRAAAEVGAFRPLPGLGDLHEHYRSAQIPAVFEQRVMSPERPDYEEYLTTLGLTSHATPWEQIVGSGGGRAGDTLQFMQVPNVIDGRAVARFFANGIRHAPEASLCLPGRVVQLTPEQHEAALLALQDGDPVLLEAEQGNPEDPNAILLTSRGVPLGWVPRVLSSSLRPLVEGGACHAQVHRIGQPGTPHHLRLVLDFDEPAPDGFTFDPEGRWEPLADQ